MASQKTVTIGLPVYNGGEFLSGALDSLLAQTYRHVQIIISDNASTDQTQKICQTYATRFQNIRYVRNQENIGPSANFQQVALLADSDYFLWAAHDDAWSSNYIQTLVDLLEQSPNAILATPLTKHVHADLSASKHSDDRPAPGTSALKNLRSFYRDHSCTWIYGVYRTAWLKTHMLELDGYNVYGGDMLWMVDNILRFSIIGSDQAVIYKRIRKSCFTPRDQSSEQNAWRFIFRRLQWLSWHRPDSVGERIGASWASAWYVYRKYLRKGGPIHTGQKIVHLVTSKKAA